MDKQSEFSMGKLSKFNIWLHFNVEKINYRQKPISVVYFSVCLCLRQAERRQLMPISRKNSLGFLFLLPLTLSLTMVACTTAQTPKKYIAHYQSGLSQAKARQMTQQIAAENTAAGPVLLAAIQRIDKGLILKGSCFDFVEAVYREAGFKESKRKTVYTARQTGPYASSDLLQAGDWIYYDHNYRVGADHSCIFVAWLDEENHSALTIDYPGANRAVPGRFVVDTLYKVWGITRPKT